MLLSRRMRVQPSGAVIVPLPGRRGVTVEISTLPLMMPDGRTIVSDEDFAVRELLPTASAPFPSDAGARSPASASNEPHAVEVAEPANAAIARKAVLMSTTAFRRGRLPNMPCASAHLCALLSRPHSTGVPSSVSYGPGLCDSLRLQECHCVRTLLIHHDDSTLDRDVVAPWLGSFSELCGIVVIREPRSNQLARIRREVKRSGVLRFLDVLAFRLYYRAATGQE